MSKLLYQGHGSFRIITNEDVVIYVDPYIGVSYAVGGIIRLTLKTDWMFAVNNEGLNRPLGPRIYFGILFSR